MSGVTGSNPIPSRKEFDYIVREYKKILKNFPGYIDAEVSGSYNSDKSKDTFGDIDLIVTIKGDDKKTIKKDLAIYLTNLPEKSIVKFTFGKNAGKRYYNSGEIITVNYKAPKSDEPHQIDNIISLSKDESDFKLNFLNMPAAKQGLLLGATKVALISQDPNKIFKLLHITPPTVDDNQSLEFNASYKEIQLRKLTYKPNTYKEINREIIWSTKNWKDLEKILYSINFNQDFESLLKELKRKFNSKRAKTRIAGVFKSMVSIKSGEVGKLKGDNKQKAIDAVSKALEENTSISKFDSLANRILTIMK